MTINNYNCCTSSNSIPDGYYLVNYENYHQYNLEFIVDEEESYLIVKDGNSESYYNITDFQDSEYIEKFDKDEMYNFLLEIFNVLFDKDNINNTKVEYINGKPCNFEYK